MMAGDSTVVASVVVRVAAHERVIGIGVAYVGHTIVVSVEITRIAQAVIVGIGAVVQRGVVR